MNKLNKALVKLTHTVIDDKSDVQVKTADYIDKGIIFIDESGLVESISTQVANSVVNYLNRNYSIWNRHFHQTWTKVADAPIEQLVWE